MLKMLRYNQTKLNILHQIADLSLQVGDALPTERRMASEFGISMGTLRRALGELEVQGIIEKHQGSGNTLLKSIKNGGERNKIALIYIKRIEFEEVLPNMRALELYLNERGIDIEYIPVIRFDDELIKVLEKCFAVLITGWIDENWIKNLQLLNKPMIAIGSHKYSDILPFVSYDWKGASSILTGKLIQRNAKRIGLLNAAQRYYPSSLIYEGYRGELLKAGLELDNDMVIWVEKENYYEKVKKFIIEQVPKLDSIVMELGLYLPFLALCWELGVTPDKKLAVIGNPEDNYQRAFFGGNILWAAFERNTYIAGAEFFLEALRHKTKF